MGVAVVRVGRHGRLVVVRLRLGRMPCIDSCPLRQPLYPLRILVTNDEQRAKASMACWELPQLLKTPLDRAGRYAGVRGHGGHWERPG